MAAKDAVAEGWAHKGECVGYNVGILALGFACERGCVEILTDTRYPQSLTCDLALSLQSLSLMLPALTWQVLCWCQTLPHDVNVDTVETLEMQFGNLELGEDTSEPTGATSDDGKHVAEPKVAAKKKTRPPVPTFDESPEAKVS